MYVVLRPALPVRVKLILPLNLCVSVAGPVCSNTVLFLQWRGNIITSFLRVLY
jgi:hypothetical protein